MLKVGVIGGGQLAQMLALAAYPLGIKIICLEPTLDCPAALVTEVIQGEYADAEKLAQLAEQVDVMTYEFENIPLVALEKLTNRYAIPVYPSVAALAVSQDRFKEKCFFEQLAIPTTHYVAINSLPELYQALEHFELPAILKTRCFGYDGKGQYVLRAKDDVEIAWQQLKDQPLLLENLIPFEREVSCLAARGIDGSMIFYPLITNQHQAGILRLSTVMGANTEIERLAQDYVKKILTALNYVGVIAVEFFQKNGQLIANEMAPRVHNSGHWTIEGACTSQFENHLRAITGLPLGLSTARGQVAMLNLIGHIPKLSQLLQISGAHCHLYGKEARPGRKLGHVTLCLADKELFAEKLLELKSFHMAE